MSSKRARKNRKRQNKRITQRAATTATPVAPEDIAANSAKYIEKADFRLGFITTVAQDAPMPDGRIHKAGEIVQVAARSKMPGNKHRSFAMPDMTSIYLDVAHKAYKAAERLNKRVTYFDSTLQPSISHLSGEPALLYDVFEQRATAIVFAFSSLEAFANSIIPTDYTYTRTTKKSTEQFSKEQIERHVMLDEKLSKVLVDVKQVGTVINEPFWTDFIALKTARDKLIHLKHHDIYNADHPDEDAVWDVLNTPNFEDYAVKLQPLFEHYFPDPNSRPRWITKIPFWKHD